MNPEVAAQYLRFLGAATITTRPGWVNGTCPYAPWRHEKGTDSNPSFGVSLKDRYCKCLSCGSTGSLEAVVLELRQYYTANGLDTSRLGSALRLLEGIEEVIPEWSDSALKFNTLTPWPEWWLDSFMPAWGNEASRNYLLSRGVSEATAKAVDLRVDFVKSTVVFPLRGFEGELLGARGRVFDELSNRRFHDYTYEGVNNSGKIWLGESLVDLGKPVVLVEGNFDYAKVYEVYPNVLACMTSTPPLDKINRLSAAWNIVLMFDNDAAGKGLADKIEQTLGAGSIIERVNYDAKDPGSLDYVTLRDILKNQVPLKE